VRIPKEVQPNRRDAIAVNETSGSVTFSDAQANPSVAVVEEYYGSQSVVRGGSAVTLFDNQAATLGVGAWLLRRGMELLVRWFCL